MNRLDENKAQQLVKIDRKDQKMLELLAEDARMSFSQLGKRVKASRESITYRYQRLCNKRVILRPTLRVNFAALGYGSFHLFYSVKKHQYDQFIVYLKKLDCVHQIIEYAEKWDVQVVFIAKNVQELDKICQQLQSTFSDTILQRSFSQELQSFNTVLFPLHFHKQPSYATTDTSVKTKNLDHLDYELMKYLSIDSRLTSIELSRKISLSHDAITKRIKKLLTLNVISKFTLLLNFSALQYHWTTFTFSIKSMTSKDEKTFAHFVEVHPAIKTAMRTIGENDIILFVIAQKNSEFYQVTKDLLSSFGDHLSDFSSLPAYREVYYNPFPATIK